MKASSIALLFRPRRDQEDETMTPSSSGNGKEEVKEVKKQQAYVVNLIDSPGHVDFCSEVSSSVRLSDGAVVLVDACEGVCIQTFAVLRQVWNERLGAVLVLNKMDRLFTELGLDPEAAYARCERIVTDVNSIMSMFQSEKHLSEADAFMTRVSGQQQRRDSSGSDAASTPGTPVVVSSGDDYRGVFADDNDDEEDEDVFDVQRGNVIFASAIDGWAFRTSAFARLYARRLGCSEAAMSRALWGPYYYNAKTKKIVGKKSAKQGMKPMFVQMVLEPIYRAYSLADYGDATSTELRTMSSKLGISLPKRDLDNAKGRAAVQCLMRAWLPLADAVMEAIVDALPSPIDAAPTRMMHLMPPPSFDDPDDASRAERAAPDIEAEIEVIDEACTSCDASDAAPVVAFVSKIVPVPAHVMEAARAARRDSSQISDALTVEVNGECVGTAPCDDDEVEFLGVCRVFAGTIRPGQQLYVLFPNHDPRRCNVDAIDDGGRERMSDGHETPQPTLARVRIQGVYMMMGTSLDPLDAASAGSIVALEGVSEAILRSATLSSSARCRAVTAMAFQSAPLVRVAVEPKDPSELPRLVAGLKLLRRADPFVEVIFRETGEHIIGAAGEVHLGTCIEDLQGRFAKVELEVSPPLVSFRESVADAGDGGEMQGSEANGDAHGEQEGDARGTRPRNMEPNGPSNNKSGSQEAPPPPPSAETLAMPWGDITESTVPSAMATVRIRVAPMDLALARAIDESEEALRPLLLGEGADDGGSSFMRPRTFSSDVRKDATSAECPLASTSASMLIRKAMSAEKQREGEHSSSIRQLSALLASACAFGPKKCGANILVADVDALPEPATPPSAIIRARTSAACALGIRDDCDDDGAEDNTNEAESDEQQQRMFAAGVESSLVTGFQLATAAGPLCEEPLWAVVICADVVLHASEREISASEEQYGPFSGQLIAAAREACRSAVRASSPRLVEALYLCEATTTAETLGSTYAVLGRRRAKILREEMQEGTGLFSVHAYLPVASSFKFADEMRRSTSGAASAQLVLSHWVRLDIDPFFVPTTFEEREEHGEGGETGPNVARLLIDDVRRRRGLYVQEKVVSKATKQRTLARKV